MGGLFSTPKTPEPEPVPEPEPLPPAPERSDTEVAAAAEEQRKRFFGATSGRATTLLTGPQGATSTSSTVRLLGGVGR